MTRPSLALALLTACPVTAPEGEPTTLTPAIQAGLAQALDCGKRNFLRVQHPPETLRFFLSSDLATADWVQGRSIWVDQRVAGEERVWFHAGLHALYGLVGHPQVFTDCGILEI
jgi:hypothetical protein